MSAKPKGMADSPLTDLFTPTAPPAPAPPVRGKKRERKQREQGEHSPQREQREHKATGTRQRFTVHLPPDLVEQLRRVAYYVPGVTLSGLAEQALRQAAARLEKDHGPFPEGRGSLKGRPVKL